MRGASPPQRQLRKPSLGGVLQFLGASPKLRRSGIRQPSTERFAQAWVTESSEVREPQRGETSLRVGTLIAAVAPAAGFALSRALESTPKSREKPVPGTFDLSRSM